VVRRLCEFSFAEKTIQNFFAKITNSFRGDIDKTFFGIVLSAYPAIWQDPDKLNGKNAQIECELIWAFFLHVDGMPAAAIA
jgi:hypothetical protein